MITPTRLPTVYESIIHILADAAARSPKSVALQCGEERLTYAEYVSCVAVLAHRLAQYLGKNPRIALVAGNSVHMAVTMLAVQAARGQIVPVNPAYTDRELAEILVDADPALVLCDAGAFERVRSVLEGLASPIACISLAEDEFSLLNLRLKPPSALPMPMPTGADIASIQYTGGTTGRSKGVEITHGQICINISQREASLPTRPDTEVVLCVMPLFHVFATAMCLHLTLYCRGRLVLLPQYHVADALAAIAMQRVTILPAGPTVFSALLAHPNFRTTVLDSLRICFSGSAPLRPEVLREWEHRTSTRIMEGYGQTEAGPVISYMRATEEPCVGSVGKPLLLTEVQIVDLATGERVLPDGERGEIRVRGPQIMSGYRNRPDETAATLRGRWLYTGDIGCIDAAGRLFIGGRKKEMAIVGGYNVYPREIEDVLCTHPEIQEAAALGIPDPHRGEIIAACVVLTRGSRLTASVIEKYCGEHLVSYKIPRFIEFTTSLPRTSVGKIDKARLLRQFLDLTASQNGMASK